MSEAIYDDPNALSDSQCFNNEAIESVYNLIEGFKHGNGFFDTLIKVASAAYVFSVNLQMFCKGYQIVYDLATYCFRSSQCDSFDIYVYNLGVNFFPIVLNLL